jgi:hypothetical protein
MEMFRKLETMGDLEDERISDDEENRGYTVVDLRVLANSVVGSTCEGRRANSKSLRCLYTG